MDAAQADTTGPVAFAWFHTGWSTGWAAGGSSVAEMARTAGVPSGSLFYVLGTLCLIMIENGEYVALRALPDPGSCASAQALLDDMSP